MPTILREPESIKFRDLQDFPNVLKSMQKIRDGCVTNGQGAPLVLNENHTDLRSDMDCHLFRGLEFEFLQQYLDEDCLEDAGRTAEEGLQYWIYSVPEKYVRIINAVLDTNCKRYHRIYLQIQDGIVSRDFGELCSSERG